MLIDRAKPRLRNFESNIAAACTFFRLCVCVYTPTGNNYCAATFRVAVIFGGSFFFFFFREDDFSDARYSKGEDRKGYVAMYMIELDEENFIRITRHSIKSFVNLSMFILRYYPPTRLASLSSSLTISFRIFSFFFQSHPFRFEDSKIISPI